MITSTFESVMDGSNLVAKRLTLFFNGKIICTTDFPADVDMTEDQRNSYIAGKLSGILS